MEAVCSKSTDYTVWKGILHRAHRMETRQGIMGVTLEDGWKSDLKSFFAQNF